MRRRPSANSAQPRQPFSDVVQQQWMGVAGPAFEADHIATPNKNVNNGHLRNQRAALSFHCAQPTKAAAR